MSSYVEKEQHFVPSKVELCGSRPRLGSRIPDLSEVEHVVVLVVAAGEDDAAVGKRRGAEVAARRLQSSNVGPRVSSRVVDLDGGDDGVGVITATEHVDLIANRLGSKPPTATTTTR